MLYGNPAFAGALGGMPSNTLTPNWNQPLPPLPARGLSMVTPQQFMAMMQRGLGTAPNFSGLVGGNPFGAIGGMGNPFSSQQFGPMGSGFTNFQQQFKQS